jgi:hypothetical protein
LRSTDRQDEDVRDPAFASPEEAREIELVVSLLRSLPDPEPSMDLTARVMQRVREIESRPRVLRVDFGLEARSALALAAGVACIAIAVGLAVREQPQPTIVAIPTSPGPLGVARISRFPIPQQGIVIAAADPRTAALFAGSPAEAVMPVAPAVPVAAVPAPELLDRRLDAQLNELQLDPPAFFRRLERVHQRDRFVQRLADRAARRGDAAQVALAVRTVQHPLATPMVDQFLHASLVREVGGR